MSRLEAKRALGYGPEVIVLLTIASPFKYTAPNCVSFLELVIPVLEALPQAILVAVGPGLDRSWEAARERTGGRIKPIGIRWDNELLYSAADIYLDSVPFSSITSVLEAGIQGTPVLGFMPPDSDLELLGPGAPGLDTTIDLAHEPESYRALLTELITNSELRCRKGEAVRTRILSHHAGENWRASGAACYAKVEQIAQRNCLVASTDTFAPTHLNVALSQLYKPWNIPQMTRNFIGTLPFRSRLRIACRLFAMGFPICYSNFFPPPLHGIVLRIARLAKASYGKILALNFRVRCAFTRSAPPIVSTAQQRTRIDTMPEPLSISRIALTQDRSMPKSADPSRD
jgi:hypothetical protein